MQDALGFGGCETFREGDVFGFERANDELRVDVNGDSVLLGEARVAGGSTGEEVSFCYKDVNNIVHTGISPSCNPFYEARS